MSQLYLLLCTSLSISSVIVEVAKTLGFLNFLTSVSTAMTKRFLDESILPSTFDFETVKLTDVTGHTYWVVKKKESFFLFHYPLSHFMSKSEID